MSGGVVVLGLGGLAFAGVGLYVLTRHEPTPRERLVDAVISPIEAASGAVSTGITLAPFIPLIVVLLLVGLAALIVLVVGPAFGRGLAGTAIKRAGG